MTVYGDEKNISQKTSKTTKIYNQKYNQNLNTNISIPPPFLV